MSQKAVSDIVNELESQVIYDVTANNDGVTFGSLSALLSDENLSTLIPSTVRCGGMSIRFIQSSDNKYVQYRLMSDTFNTTLANWQGVDDEPIVKSKNLITSGGVYESFEPISGGTVVYDNSLCTIQGGVIGNDGHLIENVSYYHSDYIKIEGAQKLTLIQTKINLTSWGAALYSDTNEESFIRFIPYTTTLNEYDLAPNEKYLRYSLASKKDDWAGEVTISIITKGIIPELQENVAELTQQVTPMIKSVNGETKVYASDYCGITNGVINNNGGILSGSEHYRHSDYIDVTFVDKISVIYSVDANTWGAALYSDTNEGSFVRFIPYTTTLQEYKLAKNEKYIRFSAVFPISSYGEINITAVRNGISLKLENLQERLSKSILNSFVYVSQKGDGDFMSISDALTYIGVGNPVNILLGEGVYDEIVVAQNKYPSFNLIGVNRDNCVLINKTGRYKNAPLQIAGNFFLENITFKMTLDEYDGFTPGNGENMPGYAIHIDYRGFDNTKKANGVIRNCKFYSEAFPAAGLGLNTKQNIEFDNCEFERNLINPNFEISAWPGAFLIHNALSNTAEDMSLILKNCIFRSNSNAAAIIKFDYDYGQSSANTTLLAINNVFVNGGAIGGVIYQKADSILDIASHGNSDSRFNAY